MGILGGIIGSLGRALSSNPQDNNQSSDYRKKSQSYTDARQNYQNPNEEYQPNICGSGYCHYYVPVLTNRLCKLCNDRRDAFGSDGKPVFTCQKDYHTFTNSEERCKLGGCSRQNYEPVYSRAPSANRCPLPIKR